VITRRDAALHLGLFLAACATTTWYGGPAFAATLMGILTCHELGHFFVGLHHEVDVSLPYFIPTPPQLTLGTLGAVIRMRTQIKDRGALFDVGASGPIAGLVVAIPLLVLGLHLSHIGPVGPDDYLEGNSILYALLKRIVFGAWYPQHGWDVQLHPVAQAAWVGLLITMINLIPIGQLDGGHIARAVLGNRHERWSRRLHIALPVVGLVVGTSMFLAARSVGNSLLDAAEYAMNGALPWLVWTVLLAVLRRQSGEYHPPVGEEPLPRSRKLAAAGMLLVFLAIATPVPFRPAL
jgi:membrane-associated protease RseP (regulator of RpoE activity)